MVIPGRGYWIPPRSDELYPRPLSAAICSRATLMAFVTRDIHTVLSMGIGGRSAFIDTEDFNIGRGSCCVETPGESLLRELLLKVVPLNEMPGSLMFRGAQNGQRRCPMCVLSGLYGSRSQGDEEQVGESALDRLSSNTAATGLATPFCFLFSSSTRLRLSF